MHTLPETKASEKSNTAQPTNPPLPPWPETPERQPRRALLPTVAVVQSLSRVRLFPAMWTAARQASLSFTISQSWLKLMSIGSVMPSNHLILCRPLLLLPSSFPSIRGFSNKLALCIRCQSIGASASGSALPMNIQD